jgi:hypothetical protein
MHSRSRARLEVNKVVLRINEIRNSYLYTKRSTVTIRRNGQESIIPGKGLFCTSTLYEKDIIVYYSGEWITLHEMEIRVRDGYGGYMHRARTTDALKVLDCYASHSEGHCLASNANSATNAFHKVGGEWIKLNKNAGIVVSRNLGAKLVVTAKCILPNVEILTTYGTSYKYPN